MTARPLSWSTERRPGRAEAAGSGSEQGNRNEEAVERIWRALREVEDPELPVSLVDMGLIVAADYDPERRLARLKITYTAMGCPAMEMIQDDIRARLLREPAIDAVEMEVVWDPVWTPRRLSRAARERLRVLGIGV